MNTTPAQELWVSFIWNSVSGGLNEKGPHRLIGISIIGGMVLLEDVSLGVGIKVLEAQARPSGSLSSCCLLIQM